MVPATDAATDAAVDPTYDATYGHWVEIQLNQSQADMENALDASPHIVGAHRRWFWKDIETTENTYVWTDIDAHLATCAARGKKLVVFLMDKGFVYDGKHPCPADMQHGMANETEFEYISGAWSSARWHTRWRARMKNILTLIYQRYDGNAAFEGVALQETPMGSPWSVTVDGQAYSREAYVAAYSEVFADTAVYRPRSWLYWYGTWFSPPKTEVLSMSEIRAAATGKRVAFGITNARTWEHEAPSGATGWPNNLKDRIFDSVIASSWAEEGFPMFAAHQADDFQYAGDSESDPQRDILYNYERITRDTSTRGPGGDVGFANWTAKVKTFVWNYQKSPVGAAYKQRFDANVADKTLADAVSIINTEPRWWEAPAPYVMSALAFPGSTYLQYQGASALAANGGEFTLAFWINMAGSTDGALYNLLAIESASSAVRIKVTRNTGNKIAIQARNTSDVDALAAASVKSGSSVLATSGWKLVMISGKRSINTLQIYFGDTSEYAAGTWTDASADLYFSDAYRVTIGASWAGADAMIGQIGAAYFANWFTDLSQEKYRRAMITAAGKPVFPGHQGKRYDANTGAYNESFRQPLLYLGDPIDVDALNTGGTLNRGSWESAGAWTKTGGAISAGTPP